MKKNFIEKAMPTFYNIIEIYWKIDSVQKILIILAQLSIFLISIKFIKEGVITTGELVAFNSYASMMFYPFIILGRSWQRIQSGVIELTEAQKIFDSPPEVYKPKDGISIQKLKGEVEFNNVFFKYKESSRVLSDISFKVEPGKKIALVGKSGVGKSTIISLILAINLPTQGKILIDGNRLDKINLTSYRRQVGIVNQEPTLFNDTIRYNIKYGSFGISDEKMIQAAKKAHIHKLIKSLDKGYDQRVGWKGIKLSIGQKQRIALARAFLKDPRILILDEPTSALDAKSEYLIQESLEELMQGKTTFIIAHRLSTIRSVDRILVFEKGKLVEDGSHKELLKNENGTYKSLYDYQIGVYKDQN